jgi:hypothetical protein
VIVLTETKEIIRLQISADLQKLFTKHETTKAGIESEIKKIFLKLSNSSFKIYFAYKVSLSSLRSILNSNNPVFLLVFASNLARLSLGLFNLLGLLS